MRNHSIAVIILSLLVILTSCEKESLTSISPSSEITIETKNISDYNKLNVTSEFNVFVKFSDTEEKIEVEANENLQFAIIVEKDGKTLDIRLKNNINIKGSETMNVYITTKEIISYQLTGEATVTLQNDLTTNGVQVSLTGESTFTAKVAVQDLTTDLTGESRLNLTGTAASFDANITGESQIHDYDFVCQNLDITLTGDSKAYLTIMDELSVNASGESVLHYKGSGTIVNQSLSGEAKIQKED